MQTPMNYRSLGNFWISKTNNQTLCPVWTDTNGEKGHFFDSQHLWTATTEFLCQKCTFGIDCAVTACVTPVLFNTRLYSYTSKNEKYTVLLPPFFFYNDCRPVFLSKYLIYTISIPFYRPFVLQISRTPLMRSDNLSTGCVSWYFGSVPSWDDNRKRTSEWMFVNKTSIPRNLMYW